MNDDEKIKEIRELAKAGRIVMSENARKYFERAKVILPADKADFTVVDVQVEFWGPYDREDGGNKGGMEIHWSTVSAGFGSLTVFIDKDGKLKADTENMGPTFCKAVLAKLVESWTKEE